MISAIEFSMNTVPIATAISSSSACRIGPTAAIADPPQIAVPVAIRNDGVPFTRNARPMASPMASANVMLIAV